VGSNPTVGSAIKKALRGFFVAERIAVDEKPFRSRHQVQAVGAPG